MGAVLDGVDDAHAGLLVFDFLGNAVLAEADLQIANAMPGGPPL